MALLEPSKMYSGAAYNQDVLRDMLEKAHQDNFNQEGLLRRIVTLEMAMRSVNAAL
jgi:hypothetical protein